MAKIDFSKVERQLTDALHSMFVKKLYEGKPSVSKRAVTFYAMDSGPRPKPRDAVVDELEAIEKEEKEFEKQERERKIREEENIRKGLLEQQMHEEGSDFNEPKAEAVHPENAPITEQKQPVEIPQREYIPTTDEVPLAHPSMLQLRRLVLWMKQKRVIDLFKYIGTTEEEYLQLRRKTTLTSEDEERIEQILKMAKQVKGKILKKLGIEEDATLIAKEAKKHKTKRFNIKDTWLPL